MKKASKKDSNITADRQIVARVDRIGHMYLGPMKQDIYRYLTFYRGNDMVSTCARFAGKAPVDEEGVLKVDAIDPGCFVVQPGLLYKPVPFPDRIMNIHLHKMKTFTPKVYTEAFYDTDAPVIDTGVIDLTKDGIGNA